MASVPPVKGEEISFDISKADLLSLPLSLYAPRKHKEEIIKLYTEKKEISIFSQSQAKIGWEFILEPTESQLNTYISIRFNGYCIQRVLETFIIDKAPASSSQRTGSSLNQCTRIFSQSQL
jgi:hypothetical protein